MATRREMQLPLRIGECQELPSVKGQKKLN